MIVLEGKYQRVTCLEIRRAKGKKNNTLDMMSEVYVYLWSPIYESWASSIVGW